MIIIKIIQKRHPKYIKSNPIKKNLGLTLEMTRERTSNMNLAIMIMKVKKVTKLMISTTKKTKTITQKSMMTNKTHKVFKDLLKILFHLNNTPNK